MEPKTWPRPLRVALALRLLLLASLAGTATAQLGDAPQTIVDQLSEYQLEQRDGRHVAGPGFAFTVEEVGGTATAVVGDGQLTDANARFIGALVGAASGYGPGIASPVTDFLRTRSEELKGSGPVVVQVQEYQMEVEVSEGEVPAVRLRFFPQTVDEALFGPPARSLGPTDATYVVREFTDLQCPFCAAFAERGMPVVEELLARGDVRFEVHHFPLKSIHPNATVAAETTECVAAMAEESDGADAGTRAFFDYSDALFEHQASWSGLPDPVPELIAIAESVGLPTDGVEACVLSGRYSQVVEDSYRKAVQDLGLTGTPTLFVNGLKLGDYLEIGSYERLMRLSDALAAEGEGDAQGED